MIAKPQTTITAVTQERSTHIIITHGPAITKYKPQSRQNLRQRQGLGDRSVPTAKHYLVASLFPPQTSFRDVYRPNAGNEVLTPNQSQATAAYPTANGIRITERRGRGKELEATS